MSHTCAIVLWSSLDYYFLSSPTKWNDACYFSEPYRAITSPKFEKLLYTLQEMEHVASFASIKIVRLSFTHFHCPLLENFDAEEIQCTYLASRWWLITGQYAFHSSRFTWLLLHKYRQWRTTANLHNKRQLTTTTNSIILLQNTEIVSHVIRWRVLDPLNFEPAICYSSSLIDLVFQNLIILDLFAEKHFMIIKQGKHTLYSLFQTMFNSEYQSVYIKQFIFRWIIFLY